jgi:arginyl-tRNA--protein-N-Asp/Glu arginylyltransferase
MLHTVLNGAILAAGERCTISFSKHKVATFRACSFHLVLFCPSPGRLVAVGVVDVLPRCLSSKYLFWDPGGWGAALNALVL